MGSDLIRRVTPRVALQSEIGIWLGGPRGEWVDEVAGILSNENVFDLTLTISFGSELTVPEEVYKSWLAFKRCDGYAFWLPQPHPTAYHELGLVLAMGKPALLALSPDNPDTPWWRQWLYRARPAMPILESLEELASGIAWLTQEIRKWRTMEAEAACPAPRVSYAGLDGWLRGREWRQKRIEEGDAISQET